MARLGQKIERALSIARNTPEQIPAMVRGILRRSFPFDYYTFKSGRSFAPAQVTFEITHRCNLKCKMCDLYGIRSASALQRSRLYDQGELLQIQELKRVIDEVAGFSPVISITGGEPALYAELFEFIGHVKKRRLVCTLTTNGTLLTQNAERVATSGIDTLIVSLDGPEEIHDRIRGVQGTFQKVIQGIEALRRNPSGAKLRVHLNVTMCGANYDRLREVLPIASNLGITRVVFSHLWFWTEEIVSRQNRRYGGSYPATVQNVWGKQGLVPSVLSAEMEKIRSSEHDVEIVLMPNLSHKEVMTYYNRPSEPVGERRCLVPWMSARILPNGDVMPCLDIVMGNVKEKAFRQIWNGAAFRRFRHLLQAQGIMPACVRCCGLFMF